MSVFLLTKLTS